MSTTHFEISVPADEEFLGRECNNPNCLRYFRVDADHIQSRLYCPYCGTNFSNDELHTQDQIKYLEESGEEQALEYMHKKIDKMFSKMSRQFRGNQFISVDYKPTRYRAKQITPRYRELKVDSELRCPECSFLFQVYGLFGFCPGCGVENMLIYDANLTIIRREIQSSDQPTRALRHAYSDLVSTFETFCAKKAPEEAEDKPSFQELFPTRKFFKKVIGVDILEGLKDDELLTIRRVFQKRHSCQHCEGRVTDQYVKKIPEDVNLIGTEVELSLDEFEKGAKILRHIVDRLVGTNHQRI